MPGLDPLPKPAQAEAKVAEQKAIQDAVNAEKNAKLGKKQAKIAFDTQDTANLLKPVAKDAAKKLDKAEKAMKDAKEDLVKNEPKKAAEPQAKATDKLQGGRARARQA